LQYNRMYNEIVGLPPEHLPVPIVTTSAKKSGAEKSKA
jgi:hypothetical protein